MPSYALIMIRTAHNESMRGYKPQTRTLPSVEYVPHPEWRSHGNARDTSSEVHFV